MPKVLETLWERRSGVPNEVMVRFYMGTYRYMEDAKSADDIAKSKHEQEVFRSFLPYKYAGAAPEHIAGQLVNLRKGGYINLLGGPGPTKGYKKLAIESLRFHLTGILSRDLVNSVCEKVREDLKNRVDRTPTQQHEQGV